MACRWVVQGGVRFHIPDCWGTVHDPDGPCHCTDKKENLDERIEALEATVERLMKRLETPQ
jgi:hypothetical protein